MRVGVGLHGQVVIVDKSVLLVMAGMVNGSAGMMAKVDVDTGTAAGNERG